MSGNLREDPDEARKSRRIAISRDGTGILGSMQTLRAPLLALLATVALVIAACGSTSTEPASSGGAKVGGESAPETEWLREPITDVTGETFTIASLEGKPVFVENFATWCSNCLKQLGKTQEAAADAGDDAVFIALSVETDIDPSEVGDYAQDNGFDDIRFAVMTPDMLAAMNDAYGKTALNPPSTPKVIVAADGTPGEMTTGFEEPASIAEDLAAP